MHELLKVAQQTLAVQSAELRVGEQAEPAERAPFVRSMLRGVPSNQVHLLRGEQFRERLEAGATSREGTPAGHQALAEPKGGSLFLAHGQIEVPVEARGEGRDEEVGDPLSRQGSAFRERNERCRWFPSHRM